MRVSHDKLVIYRENEHNYNSSARKIMVYEYFTSFKPPLSSSGTGSLGLKNRCTLFMIIIINQNYIQSNRKEKK
jgi:hypothetical protein